MTNITMTQYSSIAEAQVYTNNWIDERAGVMRTSWIAPGDNVADEYRLAQEQAEAFAAGGYIGMPGQAVITWKEAGGFTTYKDAADDILATAVFLEGLMEIIRNIRLKRKANVNAATTYYEIEYQRYLAAKEFNALA